jgi:predicted ATPase/class 3 adenylate cyclase
MMPDLPRGTVAFLFTDIEGSTALWERDHAAMAAAVDRHLAILHEVVTGHGGVLFKTVGDGTQAAFPTVPHAIAAAVAAQVALRKEAWAAPGPLRVRMAIHVGEATPHDGDYLAPALNRLSRVLAIGHGEQVLLTGAARALSTMLPLGYDLRDLGMHRLRDLIEAEHLFQLAGPGLPATFPPLRSLDRQLHNLPAQATPLLGREHELVTLRQLLAAPGTRLITLTGPGGTGKTRIALQAAAESLESFPDGVWWISLAAVSHPDHVAQAIAGPLNVRENSVEPLLESLVADLRSRQTLLLLDNLEHLLDAAPQLQRLLEAAPGLVILATSREPLRLRAEREFPVAPLPLPRNDARVSLPDALASPAVRLFVERAQTVKPGFALDASTVTDVVAICRRLDGLPLAIELAAARVRLLPPAALLSRLERRLAILTGGARDLPARQQTLRAAIAWSFDLLEPAERSLFSRLAVFSGGCTLQEAEAVCSTAGGLPLDLLDGIDSLVQKSLLRQEDGPGGEPRFTMLETIHEFARERLTELPEASQLRRAHAKTFLALAEEADSDDHTDDADFLSGLEADHANFRQAVAYYRSLGAAGLDQWVRLVTALAYFWRERGHLSEGRRELEAAVGAEGDIHLAHRAAALSKAALLAEAQADLDGAQRLQEDALAIHREVGDLVGIADSLTGLGVIARQRGDLRTAHSRHQEALAAWRRADDVAGTAGALLDLSLIHQLAGDCDAAMPLLKESLDLFRQLGDDLGEAHALHYLGIFVMAKGDLLAAIEQFGKSLRLWEAMNIRQMIATDFANLGEAHHLNGSLEEAEPLYEDALARFEALGDPRGQGSLLTQLGLLALDRQHVAVARRLLRESLRLRLNTGQRGAAAETLEALAEATWCVGEREDAAKLLLAADRLRQETGLVRQPVYEVRYQRVRAALGDDLFPMPPLDIDQILATAIGRMDTAAPAAT